MASMAIFILHPGSAGALLVSANLAHLRSVSRLNFTRNTAYYKWPFALVVLVDEYTNRDKALKAAEGGKRNEEVGR